MATSLTAMNRLRPNGIGKYTPAIDENTMEIRCSIALKIARIGTRTADKTKLYLNKRSAVNRLLIWRLLGIGEQHLSARHESHPWRSSVKQGGHAHCDRSIERDIWRRTLN